MDVIAFLVHFGIPSPISKMGVGFKENGGGRRSNVCVWEGEVNWEMEVRDEGSAFPGPCLGTSL